jgi:hypothetical protein
VALVTAVLPVVPEMGVGPVAVSVQAWGAAVPPLLLVTCLARVSWAVGTVWFWTVHVTMAAGSTDSVNPRAPLLATGTVAPVSVVHTALAPPCCTRLKPGCRVSLKVTLRATAGAPKPTRKAVDPLSSAVTPLDGVTLAVGVEKVQPPVGENGPVVPVRVAFVMVTLPRQFSVASWASVAARLAKSVWRASVGPVIGRMDSTLTSLVLPTPSPTILVPSALRTFAEATACSVAERATTGAGDKRINFRSRWPVRPQAVGNPSVTTKTTS